jgi:hypothetical protein
MYPLCIKIFVVVDFFFATLAIHLKNYCKYVNERVKLKIPTILKHVV